VAEVTDAVLVNSRCRGVIRVNVAAYGQRYRVSACELRHTDEAARLNERDNTHSPTPN